MIGEYFYNTQFKKVTKKIWCEPLGSHHQSPPNKCSELETNFVEDYHPRNLTFYSLLGYTSLGEAHHETVVVTRWQNGFWNLFTFYKDCEKCSTKNIFVVASIRIPKIYRIFRPKLKRCEKKLLKF